MFKMAGGGDRLSELPDDLLRRVLRFAPTKEAASTTALSRRWRAPLWRSSGAVNLQTFVGDYDGPSFGRKGKEEVARFFSRRDAFVSLAAAALDASEVPVTRLTWRLQSERERDEPVSSFLHRDKDGRWSTDHNEVATVLSHRAARRVEELRLVANDWRSDTYPESEIFWNRVGAFSIALNSLPWETLRVLDITNCGGLYLPKDAAPVVLPRLWSLRLRHCGHDLDCLQGVIDAAPALAVVRLESVLIEEKDDSPSPDYDAWDEDAPLPPKEAVPRRLRCPAATVLVLERCRWKHKNYERHDYDDDEAIPHVGVEIDAPRLRRFRYKGLLRTFSFSSPPPDMERADLHFFPDSDRNSYRVKDPGRELEIFWQFVGSFMNAKDVKLRVNRLEEIAVHVEARQVELLPMFRRLERLELQGVHMPNGITAAVAIANFLRCCPVLRDMRISLTVAHHDASKHSMYTKEFLKRKFRSDRGKSIRTDSEPAIVSTEGDDGGVNYAEVHEIPALSRGSAVECLKSSLRRVGLQFQLEKSDCFGVKLIKFFVENGMVLEEIHIDNGNGKLFEHVSHKVETWMTNSSKRRKSGASDCVVLPLKR